MKVMHSFEHPPVPAAWGRERAHPAREAVLPAPSVVVSVGLTAETFNVFDGLTCDSWSGLSCTVTTDADHTVTATFNSP